MEPNTSGAATSAARCSPKGPGTASQATKRPIWLRAAIAATRRPAICPVPTEYTSCSRTCLSVRAPSNVNRPA